MKELIVVILLVGAGYQAWNQFGGDSHTVEPLKDEPYVVVYGRDSCGYTTQMREKLRRADVEFRYARIDKREVADRIHQRMRSAGIDTSRYRLPVVDVNGDISTRPEPKSVIQGITDGSG